MTDLDARYGRKPRSRRSVSVLVTALVLVTAALVWFIWANPIAAGQATLQWRDTGYLVLSDQAVDVSWEVTTEPGTAGRCAVYAMNSGFAIVGWRVLDIKPSETRIRQFREEVLTTEQAVTGLIYRCWVT